jgi:outer membrane protein assembly factor BamB
VAAARVRGHTLLVLQGGGSVVELGADGKVRWQVSGLRNPLDAEVLPGDRLLVAEVNPGRVIERNRKGEILWEKPVSGFAIGVQRLQNGNTFVAARGQLFEADRSGKEVYTIPRPTQDVMTARKLRDGRIVCVTNQGMCLTLDRDGKELKSFHLASGVQVFGNEIQPRGGVLTPITYQNKVVEYDAEGKQVWEASVAQPGAATRLPNGHTLVASHQSPAKLIELDRAGKVVSETQIPDHPVRVYRR